MIFHFFLEGEVFIVESTIERIAVTVRTRITRPLDTNVVFPFGIGKGGHMAVLQLFLEILVALRIVIGFVIFVIITVQFHAVGKSGTAPVHFVIVVEGTEINEGFVIEVFLAVSIESIERSVNRQSSSRHIGAFHHVGSVSQHMGGKTTEFVSAHAYGENFT